MQRVTSRDLNITHHILDGYVVQDNTPQVGYISWSDVHIQYQGVTYNIQDGYTNYKYVWWQKSVSTTQLVAGDTLPTLTDDDVLLFFNKNGIHMTVPKATVIDGGLIVSESIMTPAIAANAITSAKIAAGAITTTHLAADCVTANAIATGAVTADAIAANAIGAAAIASAVITGDKLVAGTITGDKIASNTITANNIASNTITADSAIIADGAITTAKIGDGQITNAKIANLDASKITSGYISADRMQAGSITADKLTVGNNINIVPYKLASFESYKNGDNLGFSKQANVISVTASNEQYLDGNLSMKVVTNSSCTDGYVYMGTSNSDYTIPIKPNTKYCYSFYAKTTATGTTKIQGWVRTNAASQSHYMPINSTLSDTDDWKRFYGTFTTPSDATKCMIRVDVDSASKTVYFDCFQLEELTSTQSEPSMWTCPSTTEINGANIIAGSITADKIAANTITAASGVIADGAITNAKIANLDASKITTGTLDASKVDVINLNASNITTGILSANTIIQSGGLVAAVYPNYDTPTINHWVTNCYFNNSNSSESTTINLQTKGGYYRWRGSDLNFTSSKVTGSVPSILVSTGYRKVIGACYQIYFQDGSTGQWSWQSPNYTGDGYISAITVGGYTYDDAAITANIFFFIGVIGGVY